MLTSTDRTPQEAERQAETGFRALIRAVGLIHRLMQPYFWRFGISPSQWGALRTLYRAEREGLSGMSPGELCNRLLVRPPSVTGLVDRLQRMGLVARSSSPVDHRGKHVRLTPEGRALIERVLPGHGGQIAVLMSGLDRTEMKQMAGLMMKLGDHLDALAARETSAPESARRRSKPEAPGGRRQESSVKRSMKR